MTTTNIKAGDKVTCIDAGPNVYIVTGKEYIVEEVRSSGELRINNGERFTYPASRFELTSRKQTGFKVGDKVKVVRDEDCSYISNGDVCTVADVNFAGRVQLFGVCPHYYEANRFELDVPVMAVPKLKLPLAVTRSTGTKVVLTASQKAGEVVMVYANSGETMEYSEADVLSKLEDGVWTVNTPAYSPPSQAVEDAKATLQAAKDALAAAEAALTAAEAANKPYLA